MPKISSVRKVLVIGSGPIVIGQAAEFDYAGTQACRALKEEGLEVVLVNSNPATIMTDTRIADRVYVEPITVDFLERVIQKERPDSLLATLGGQIGLNMAMALEEKGILAAYGVRVLGTPLSAIRRGEDRECFKQTMEKIGQPVPESVIVTHAQEALAFAKQIGYPLIIRPAYTLGGTGGGIAHNDCELIDMLTKGLDCSPIGQCLVERSIAGWKEIEFEVIRDAADNHVIVCSMENVDPVGIHTGDSIVVAPALTLNDSQLQLLRQAALDIVRALGVVGGCNVQLALKPNSTEYYVIEVNPRVSRSSALASKATGYPIAKVTSKIALGYRLDEIATPMSPGAHSLFEPQVDYIVVKFPRWPFDKFRTADRTLGPQMKATGEVMALEHSFESALLKAVRSLEIGRLHLQQPELKTKTDDEVRTAIATPDSERLFAIAEGLRRGFTTQEIYNATQIDPWFIDKIGNIVAVERELCQKKLTPQGVQKAKRFQFADKTIAAFTGHTEEEIRAFRRTHHIVPAYRMVNTYPSEHKQDTGYYYSTYNAPDNVSVSGKRKVVVLGSGPIRIGQGVEFDYCSVHGVFALKSVGYETIIINNNPETVSTDFDISDRLYFEPLTTEDVLAVWGKENPDGVLVQFGGQTAINLAASLDKAGVKILGSGVDSIDQAEDRRRFDELLTSCKILRPQGRTCFTTQEAFEAARQIGYPVMVRPSYVLGGRAMEIVHHEEELSRYMTYAVKVNAEHPVLVDHYIMGDEVEVDAICDGEEVFLPGIMQHIEKTGIHSGDSIAVYPPRDMTEHVITQIIDYTTKLALGLRLKGMMNVQYIVRDDQVYVIEVNPRSSRTVPFLSKVTGVPMVEVAVKCALGFSLKQQGYKGGLQLFPNYYAVKAPVFSFNKMTNVDTVLGPEMKSTGEVMACDYQYNRALYKAFLAAGVRIPQTGTILMTVTDEDKPEAAQIAKGFIDLGYSILATSGTAEYLQEQGIPVQTALKVNEGENNLIQDIKAGRIALVINTPNHTSVAAQDWFKIRRASVERAIACLTSIDTARGLQKVLRAMRRRVPRVLALQDLEWEREA